MHEQLPDFGWHHLPEYSPSASAAHVKPSGHSSSPSQLKAHWPSPSMFRHAPPLQCSDSEQGVQTLSTLGTHKKMMSAPLPMPLQSKSSSGHSLTHVWVQM